MWELPPMFGVQADRPSFFTCRCADGLQIRFQRRFGHGANMPTQDMEYGKIGSINWARMNGIQLFRSLSISLLLLYFPISK